MWVKVCGDYVILGGESAIFRSGFIWACGKKHAQQALRLGLLTPPLSTSAYLYFAGKAQAQLFNLFVRIEISLVCLYLKMASTKPQKGLLAKNFVLRHNS